jgi:hypothetical protein
LALRGAVAEGDPKVRISGGLFGFRQIFAATRHFVTRHSPLRLPATSDERLDAEAGFQVAHAIARHAQLGLAFVFQSHQHSAVDGGIQLLNESGIYNGRAMNADEAPGIEPFFELRQGEIDNVVVPADYRKGELVASDEVRHARHFEQRGPFANL